MNKRFVTYWFRNALPQAFSLWLCFSVIFCGCSLKRQWLQQTTQIDSLQKRVAKLDSLQRVQDEFLLELRADLGYRLERIDNKIDYLDAKFEDSQSRLMRISQKLGLRTTPASEQPETTSPTPAGADPEALYNTAYLDFTRGNFDLAIQGFSEYLKLFPDTDLSDNAQYWIGEAYFTKKEWQMALIEFEKVEKNYAKGNKLPAALYKIGLCYLNMKIRNKGKEYLNRVIKEFPNSPEAGLAKERLQTLR
jgi:tol-pal system protein YbgF